MITPASSPASTPVASVHPAPPAALARPLTRHTRAEARAWRAAHRDRRLALVPTMGFLHEGHLALMRAARATADLVMASIFVNPTQFGPGEDLDRYPRDPEGDLEKCAAAGCDAVFLPLAAEMYRPGAQTRVEVPALAAPLCGVSRPTHFAGVATVVTKLFLITGCDVAVFGEKDFQQLAVIRRFTQDLDLPVEILGHPIVREADGLAMSSRNAYLDPEARRRATCLSRGLQAARRDFEAGERDPRRLEAAVRGVVEATPGAQIDYIEARDPDSLAEVAAPCPHLVLALAVRVGATRLIDNAVLRAR